MGRKCRSCSRSRSDEERRKRELKKARSSSCIGTEDIVDMLKKLHGGMQEDSSKQAQSLPDDIKSELKHKCQTIEK